MALSPEQIVSPIPVGEFGIGYTVSVELAELTPQNPVTVNVEAYVPGLINACADGIAAVDDWPLPKAHK